MTRPRPGPMSLRMRLVAVSVAVGLVFVTGASGVAVWRVARAEDRAIAAALATRVDLARAQLSRVGQPARRAPGLRPTDLTALDLVAVVGSDGRVQVGSIVLQQLPAGDLPTPSAGRSVDRRVSLQHPDVDLAVRAVPWRGRTLLVAVDVEPFNTASSQLLALLLSASSAVLLVLAGLTWLLTGRALRSVTRLTEAAEMLPVRLSGRGLPIPHRDAELTRLVIALNRLLGRVAESHREELAFAAEAGHRLRTPVATLRAEAELALSESALSESEDAPARSALQRIVDDADRLSLAVDVVLRRGRGDVAAPAPVGITLAAVCDPWRRSTHRRGIELLRVIWTTETSDAKVSNLAEAMEPILENAVRHVEPGGHISVEARLVRADQLEVVVHNTGSELADSLRPVVFDAWVSGRGAATGGLGLWSARQAARAVGGEVTVDERGPIGTGVTFRVVLPVVAAVETQH